MKGVLIFYVNVNPDQESDLISANAFFDLILERNKEVIAKIKAAGYDVMCIPCVGEASRTEKIIFEA